MGKAMKCGGSGCSIATGSYVGTGTTGIDNPNVLSFPFVPKLVIVYGKTPSEDYGVSRDYGGFPWLYGNAKGRSDDRDSTLFVNLIWNGNTLSWYYPGSVEAAVYSQLNVNGNQYNWIAIG